MTEDELEAHLNQWARDFEDRLKRQGLPVLKGHETTGSVKKADGRESEWVRRDRSGSMNPTCHPNHPAVILDGVAMDYCQQCYDEATEVLDDQKVLDK